MRFRWLAVLAVVVVGSSLLAPFAQANTASDPNDLSYDIDFRSVTLTAPSSSKLAWTFTSWDAFKGSAMLGGTNPTLSLDTRLGDAADYRVVMGWAPTGYYCKVRMVGAGTFSGGTLTRPNHKTARCVFSLAKIVLSKPIHWRVSIKTSIGKDLAPDSGWIVGT